MKKSIIYSYLLCNIIVKKKKGHIHFYSNNLSISISLSPLVSLPKIIIDMMPNKIKKENIRKQKLKPISYLLLY